MTNQELLGDAVDALVEHGIATLYGVAVQDKETLRVSFTSKFNKSRELWDAIGYGNEALVGKGISTKYDAGRSTLTFTLRNIKPRATFSLIPPGEDDAT